MSRINRLYFYYQQLGLAETLNFILSKYFTVRINNYRNYLDLFENKSGIEIGGPSNYFNSGDILPIYSVIENLDGVNFNTDTIWTGSQSDGEAFKYETSKKSGRKYICDAVDLNLIPSEKYDFIISCNNLEHIANPLKAMQEWLRVIKPNALILLVLPNKKVNFDHNRNVTTLGHLINDYNCKISEDDLSHLDEVLKLHDLSLDPLAGTLDQFKNRSMKNYENRALHHHVFDMDLLQEIYSYFNIQIILKRTTISDHFIVGRKV